MQGIYIGSTTPRAGKSLLVFGLGVMLQRSGFSVGYMKPLGLYPQKVEERLGDADALVAQEILGQNAEADVVTPVMLPKSLHELSLYTHADPGLCMHRIKAAYAQLSANRDCMIVTGTSAFPSTGKFCGADGIAIVNELDLKTILVERFNYNSFNYDAVLSMQQELGDRLIGVILNDVPETEMRGVTEVLKPYFEARGIPVYGVIPRDPGLNALRVAELARGLNGRIVAGNAHSARMVEGFLIGTMQVENFMSRLRALRGYAVVAGGDRSDLHLAALHGQCPCLVLTGNMNPSELVRSKAEELAVPVITVMDDTYSVAKQMTDILSGKKLRDLHHIRLGIKVLQDNLQFDDLRQALLGAVTK